MISFASNKQHGLGTLSAKVMLAALFIGLIGLSGCSSWNSLGVAIKDYEYASGQVALGQTKEEVLKLLEPTQANLTNKQRKAPEQYTKDGKLTEIYFYRSRSTSDGLVTDDEFTPYIFEDGVLVGVGWTLIGGPKTQAQTRDEDPRVRFHFGHTHFW